MRALRIGWVQDSSTMTHVSSTCEAEAEMRVREPPGPVMRVEAIKTSL